MPVAMSIVWEIVRKPNKSKRYAELLKEFDEVLGLDIDKEEKQEIPEEIMKLLEERKIARENKDWQKSDEIRDKIDSFGYIVKDTKDGMEILKK